MNNIVTFNNHNIELIRHNNQPYITLPQIEGALEFAKKGKAVSNLYNIHKSEFDEEMSCLIRKGNTRIRIFNREGAWLIGMFARTPKAAEFRRWVLKVLGSVGDNLSPVGGEVSVREHMRSKPSGKKEIVLSEKAKAEIGGIVKAVVKAELNEPVEDTLTARKNASACGVTGISEQDKRSLAELVAAKVSANLMYLQRDELATKARALRQQAEVYDESVREYDRNLAQIEKALTFGL